MSQASTTRQAAPSQRMSPPSSPSEGLQRSRISDNGELRNLGGDTQTSSRATPPMSSTMPHGKTAPAHLVDTQDERRRGEARAGGGYPASPEGRNESYRSHAGRMPSGAPPPPAELGSPSQLRSTTGYADSQRMSERKADSGAREDVLPSRQTAIAADRQSQHGRNTTPTRRTGVPDSRDEYGASRREVTPTRAIATGAACQSSVRASGRAGEVGEPTGPNEHGVADPRASGAPNGRSTMRQTMNTQLAYDEFQRRQKEKAEQEEFESAHRREVARLKRQQELNHEFELEKRRMEEEALRRMEEKKVEHQRELLRVEEETRKRDEDRKAEREKKDLAYFEAEQQKRRAEKKKAEEEKRKRCEAAQKLIDEAVVLYERQKHALLELRTISEQCAKLLPQMEEVDLKAKGGKVLYHSFLRLRDATKPSESVARIDEEINHLNQLRTCDDF